MQKYKTWLTLEVTDYEVTKKYFFEVGDKKYDQRVSFY
jgi:hypothetical protein